MTSGGVTETATVNVTVSQVNDAASFGGATSGTGNEDTAIGGTLTVSDTADGMSTPNFTVSGTAVNGTASINATSGLWSYTPNADWNGTDSFTVSVTDDDGNVETQVISVTVSAVADIVGDSISTAEGTPVTVNVVTANDTFEGTPVITAVTNGANGTVSIGSGGNVTYTPTGEFNGSDSFTYTVTSGGVTETATVNVTVSQVNDAASFGGATSGTGNEDTAIGGTLTVSDTADGMSTPNFTVSGTAVNGTASINATSGLWSYTPNADWNGTDSFTVSVTDDDGNVETQVISVTVSAVADIVGDSISTAEGTPVTVNVVTANDTFEGTPVITAVTNGANGTVSIGSGGNVTYTPTGEFNGSDSFTYTVTSGGVTETATVNVTVSQVNDAASFGGATSGTGNEDTAIGGTLTVSEHGRRHEHAELHGERDGGQRHGEHQRHERAVELHAERGLERHGQLHGERHRRRRQRRDAGDQRHGERGSRHRRRQHQHRRRHPGDGPTW